MMNKNFIQWALAAAIVMAMPMCLISCNDDDNNLNEPEIPDEQLVQPTEDALDVTTDKSYVLYGDPSEGIGEAVCRRLKGSETAPFMAEVYVIDPSKSDELGIGVEVWKEMVQRTWSGEAAVVLTQCSYRSFYRFTVNYVLAALALKAEMNGEELDLGNYDSEHVAYEREVLANAVRNAYQMYRANHSAPGEVTEKDWAHIDQWPDEEQNAIMLDAYGFCQGNELYVMNAAVNKPDTINGQIIPPAQPETAYQWGHKADAVADWINRQGKEDAETRAGMENFRRAITRSEETTSKISDLMSAQQHEAILDYKYPCLKEPKTETDYGAIRILHKAYNAYDFGNNVEYYQVIQQISVRNDNIYHADGDKPGYPGWFKRSGDNKYDNASGAFMAQIYTKMKLEGKGTKSVMFVSPTNNNGGNSGSTTTSGSQGISFGPSGNVTFAHKSLLSATGAFNISYTQNCSWSETEAWNVQDIETRCSYGDPDGEVLWIHEGYKPRSFNDVEPSSWKNKGNLVATCTTCENVIWKVENPKDTYRLKAYFHVMAAILKTCYLDWTSAKLGLIKWENAVFEYTQCPFDISFVLNTPNRYKYTWNNAIYNYGSVQGNINRSAELRDLINSYFGDGKDVKDEDRCWGETFTTAEATKNGSQNARSLFNIFKERVFSNKQLIKAASFGGQIEFVLKPADDPDIIDNFILDLDKNYEGDIVSEIVNGFSLTFKVTKTEKEVELNRVPDVFQGELDIPESICNDQLTVTSVGYRCGANNKGITSIVIPQTVDSISSYAFYNLANLTNVHVKATIPPTMKEYAFNGSYSKAILYVPKGCKEAYANAADWKKFTNIVEE
jgi:hypothetical protein